MPRVYKGLQSSFVSLVWPWSGRPLSKGDHWECCDPGLEPNVVGPQSRVWQVDMFSHGWLVDQLQLAVCLTTYLTKFQPDLPQAETSCGQVCYHFGQVDLWSDVPPRQRHLVAKCVTTLVRLILGQMYPPGRDILWPILILLQVRLTFGKTFG